ncbi:MAG: response regulator transcription factor [Thermodesulfobacteriota bacterium]
MKRILIVEDNAFFLQFLKETMHLRFPSVDILEAANGEEAMQKIKTLLPEAVFMDIRLPGENGLEVTKKLKAQYPDIVVVILTNYDLPEYREAAYQSGADHFVSKDSFLNMINSILTNQDIEEGDSNSREPIEKPVMAPRPNLRRAEITVRDNGKDE